MCEAGWGGGEVVHRGAVLVASSTETIGTPRRGERDVPPDNGITLLLQSIRNNVGYLLCLYIYCNAFTWASYVFEP